MKFKLSRSDVEYLREKVPEAYERMYDFTGNDEKLFIVDDDDLEEYQLEINDAIVAIGMNHQDTVNKIGMRLYEIYDEIGYQITHS